MSFRNSIRRSGSHSILIFLFAVALTAPVYGSERLAVSFTGELSSHWLTGDAGVSRVVPAAGEVVAFGELSLGQDSVSDSSRLRLRFPDGSIHALQIDQQSMIFEFGRLVFCRFAISIPASLVANEGFALEYGDDVESQNTLVASIRAEPASRAQYRELVLTPLPTADTESEQRVKVMADRRHGHYKWLYLLPIALVVGASLWRRITGKKVVATTLTGLMILLAATSCRRSPPSTAVRVFHAAGFAPVIYQVRDACERDLHIRLQAEGSGSQEACRKVTELGRVCDVLILADNRLVNELLGPACLWRIDFATDAVVLGVGTRAPYVAEAEQDWPGVVLRDDVRLARVDENLGPIGYRTLLTLKLQEQLGSAGLHDRFLSRCQVKVDDVERLTPLLRTGEIDYAFIYRSTGIAHGVRYIELNKRVDLGSPDIEYGQAEVHFAKLKSGTQQMVAIRGAPIVWSIVEPRGGTVPELADRFVKYMVSRQSGTLEAAGFRALAKPRFYGPRDVYTRFTDVTEYAGEMK